ncbi:hypothetical protein ABBQ38_013738 [Trebouxia sp. C0009 RCD-2024]
MAKPGPKPGSKRKATAGVVKRPVGRPPKSASKPDAQPASQPAKRRGRPPKSASKPSPVDFTSSPKDSPVPKRRGRPAKAKADAGRQHHNQELEQAQSSQVQPVQAIVLEVVGTSIQPAFVIHEHGINPPDHPTVNSPDHPTAQEADKPQGVLSKVPSKKEVATAKRLAIKKTQSMKKTATKKAADVAAAVSDVTEELAHTSWGSAVWNTVTAPVSYLSSGIRRLSGHVER